MYLPECIESVEEKITTEFVAQTIIDDREHKLGLSGAVAAAWSWASEQDIDYLFHMEEDYTINDYLCLCDLALVLELRPKLAQVVLKRQAAITSPEEQLAGGFIEAHPELYTEHAEAGIVWTESSRGFSLNPCLIPRRTFDMGYPYGDESTFTDICKSAGMNFGIFGAKFDEPRVHHIGDIRSWHWKL